MNVDLHKLKELAERATESKWTTDGFNEVIADYDQLNAGYVVALCEGPDQLDNAKYIAAACPEVILHLISEIDRLGARGDHWKKVAKSGACK